MWNLIKNVLALLGVISIMYTALILWDRFHQEAKPSIQRFTAKVGFPSDPQLEQLRAFLSANVGKRIYIDVGFETGFKDAPSRVSPLRVPAPNEPLELNFTGGCRPTCPSVSLTVTPTRDVEEQLFSVTPVLWELRGYFLDIDYGGREDASWATLKPISAESVLS